MGKEEGGWQARGCLPTEDCLYCVLWCWKVVRKACPADVKELYYLQGHTRTGVLWLCVLHAAGVGVEAAG